MNKLVSTSYYCRFNASVYKLLKLVALVVKDIEINKLDFI